MTLPSAKLSYHSPHLGVLWEEILGLLYSIILETRRLFQDGNEETGEFLPALDLTKG
jgi:hypothetical protein